jgi:hypothetical protein
MQDVNAILRNTNCANFHNFEKQEQLFARGKYKKLFRKVHFSPEVLFPLYKPVEGNFGGSRTVHIRLALPLRVNLPSRKEICQWLQRVFLTNALPSLNNPQPIPMTTMANLDSHVASILDANNSDDEDALIASLEDSPALDAFREQRIQQLHSEFTRAKAQKNEGFGNYTEIKEEKALMDLTTSVKYAVVHFAKDDFARCGVMDGHLEVRTPSFTWNEIHLWQALASKHFDTRFLKMNVENAPFLVTKLKIQVLPCVLAFVNGVSVDRIVGFEGLGYTQDTFKTKDLEARLLQSGVIQRAKATGDASIKFGVTKAKKDDSDDGDDWD